MVRTLSFSAGWALLHAVPEVVLAAMAVCDRDFESALSLAAEVHEMDEARAHENESESRQCPEESTYDEEPPAQHFVPAVMGRVVDGNGRISRLSYANTRPYEHCFVDVKAISKKMPQQGSQQLLFVLVDFYSFRIHVRSMKLKSESAAALSDISPPSERWQDANQSEHCQNARNPWIG